MSSEGRVLVVVLDLLKLFQVVRHGGAELDPAVQPCGNDGEGEENSKMVYLSLSAPDQDEQERGRG